MKKSIKIDNKTHKILKEVRKNLGISGTHFVAEAVEKEYTIRKDTFKNGKS